MKQVGYYAPQRLELSELQPASAKRAPADLDAPMYGEIVIGAAADGSDSQRKFLVIVDESPGRRARLFVDSNSNGDLTDDPDTEWNAKPYDGPDNQKFTQYGGGALVQLGTEAHPFPAHLGMYRFDKNDPNRAQLRNILFYYRDYAYDASIRIGGKTYHAMLSDELVSGDYRGKPGGERSGVQLLIDVNDNGKFDSRGESFDIQKPFNIAGTTYEIVDMQPDGSSFRIVKSSQTVEEIPTPPDHAVGKPILSFAAKTMDDKTVNFPGDYRGKIVMLDFWATWCGPCMKEMPGLAKAYEAYHSQGFEILGVTLDQENAVEKINACTEKNQMTWPQVYDGKYWKAEIAQRYAINSIPAAFLVDGDTGRIIAAGDALRGDKLEPTLDAALKEKHGK